MNEVLISYSSRDDSTFVKLLLDNIEIQNFTIKNVLCVPPTKSYWDETGRLYMRAAYTKMETTEDLAIFF